MATSTHSEQEEEEQKQGEEEGGDIVFLDEEEIQALDEDDFETIDEGELGAEQAAMYNEGDILAEAFVKDDSLANFNMHKDHVYSVAVLPGA